MAENTIYQNSDFNLYRAYSYTLLLQVENSSFSYAIVQRNKLIVLVQNCELHELARPDELKDILTASYNKIIIGLPASGFSLIPERLFDYDKASGFARILDVKSHEKVLVQLFDDQNIIIYKTDEDLSLSAESYNPNKLVYNLVGWIKAIAKSNPDNNNLYLNINNETAHFLHFTSGSLRFYNSFDFNSEDDLAYYTAFVTGELNLKPQRISIIISGDADKDDKNFNRLAEFYPNIDLNNLQVVEFPPELPAHKYLSIAALSVCG